MPFKLPYGLCEGSLVTIDQVKPGLACNCFCPNCSQRLIAKKGNRVIHHFAHFNSPECAGGLETPLHRICKDIIAAKKEFSVPAYYSSKGKKMAEATVIQVENVYLEKRIDTIVPDIIIESKGRTLLVEIEVTHRIDDIKLKKIRRNGLAVVTVDASKLLKEQFAKGDYLLKEEAFQNALIYGTDFKKWLHNPKFRTIERKQAREAAQKREQLFIEENFITSPKGIVKTFKSFKKRNGFDFFYVDDCPIEKRTWKTGSSTGRHYAGAEDCRTCRFCQKLEQRPHPHTGFIKYLFPNKVDCTGSIGIALDKEKYFISGKGPKDYFAAEGRFLVVDQSKNKRFFHRFHQAYKFYLQSSSASVYDFTTGELIEQKVRKAITH